MIYKEFQNYFHYSVYMYVIMLHMYWSDLSNLHNTTKISFFENTEPLDMDNCTKIS